MYSTMSDALPSALSPDGPITARSARARGAAEAAKGPPRAPYTLLDGLKLVSIGISVARTLAPVVKTLAPIAGVMRLVGFGPLAWLGLSRRRGPFATLALFGVGIAAGAGAGLLLAPTSGAALRRSLLGGKKQEASPERAGPPNEVAAERIAPWVSASTVSIKDAPGAEIDVDAVTAKATLPAPPDHEHAAMVDSETAKPTRVNGAAGYRFG